MALTPYYSKAEADQKNKETFREVESTVNSISAGEGGILYDTLAEAQGLTTKPSNGTVFQVSEITDPTNAGYYTFQSTSTNGTRFEKPFTNGFPFSKEAKQFFLGAVQDIEIRGGNKSKQYFISSIYRNTGGAWRILLNDDTGQVAFFYATSYVEPTGIDIVNLSESNSSGIKAIVYIDWNKLPTNYNGTGTLNNSTLHNATITTRVAKGKFTPLGVWSRLGAGTITWDSVNKKLIFDSGGVNGDGYFFSLFWSDPYLETPLNVELSLTSHSNYTTTGKVKVDLAVATSNNAIIVYRNSNIDINAARKLKKIVPINTTHFVVLSTISDLQKNDLIFGFAQDGQFSSPFLLGSESQNSTINLEPVIPSNKVVLFGDSITFQNGPTNTPNANRQLNANGWFSWANLFLNNAFNQIKNSGVNGDTTVGMLDRITADVLEHNPDYCVFMAGINDINLLESTSTDLITRLKSIYDILTNANIKIITSTITPSNFLYDSGNTALKQDTWFTVNNFIKDYAKNNPNIIVCDMASVIIDPATGRPKTNWTDNTHPYPVAAIRMGKILADTLRSHIKIIDTLPIANNDILNAYPNGMMLGDTSGVADTYTIATGAGAVQTPYKEARTDNLPGEWQVIDITTEGTSNSSLNGPSIAHSFAEGEEIYAEFEVEIENVISLDLAYCNFFFQDNSYATVRSSLSMFVDSNRLNLDESIKGVYRTAPIAVPAGGIRLRASVIFKGRAKFKIGRIKINKV